MIYQSENFNGSYDFRCREHENWQIESHLHEYSELLYCKDGECDVYINGKHIVLYKKELIWLPPNYVHQYKCSSGMVVCAVFSNDLIPLYSQLSQGMRLKVQKADMSDMSDILDNLIKLKNENLMTISGYLNLICSKVVEISEFDNAGITDGVLYQKVISYISEHFREDISLKSISKRFGYNEKYLSHALHELTGIHFSKLISLYRIEYVKKQLIDDPKSRVAQIALDSGFSAINSFNRVFKEMTGITPSEYRKQQVE